MTCQKAINRFIAIAVLAIGGLAPSSPVFSQIMIGGVPSEFRPIILNSYRGLPRLGYQDTHGYAPPNGARNEVREKVRANLDDALMVGAGIESHSYSLFLLARLDFHRRYPDCSQGIGSFKAEIEQCAGTLLQHSQRTQPWYAYIESMARSMKPNVHEKIFCPAGGACGNTKIERTVKKTPDGKNIRLDEFDQRDLFARIKSQYFPAFQRYYADKSFPTEAYYVDMATLGDYDFDNQQFNIRIQAPQSIALQTNFAMGYAKTPGQVKQSGTMKPQAIALRYEAKNAFEQSLKERDGTSKAPRQVALKMAAAQARAIVQSQSAQRRVFSVVKIGLGPDTGQDTQYNPLKRMQSLAYHFADNKIEFYRDEALTDKIAEATLVNAPVQTAQDNGPTNVYNLRDDTMLFDARAFHFLRLSLGDILQSDMERIAYSVPTTERKFFRDLEGRIAEAQRDFPSGNTAKSQQAAQTRKKQAQDAAKWSNTAWSDRASWTRAQRKAFFDYLLGYGAQTEPDWSAWPDELPAVQWGLNLATIFPKGYFETDRASMGLLADAPTRAKLQEFLSDVAQTYPVNHLTGVYSLREVRYDQKTKKLTFKGWPFARQSNITFANSVGQTQKSAGQAFVHSDAKSRIVYNYRSTDIGIDGEVPDRSISACQQSQRRKSRDCGTQWSNFLQLQWVSTYLALDRAIKQPELTFEPKRGQELAQQYRGWKLVIEYSDPSMKLVPFSYKGRNDKEVTKTEGKTIFANVDRMLILSPKGEVIWSQTAAQMEAASALTQTTAPKKAAATYSFPSPVPLAPNLQNDGAIYDFLLAKYAPAKLTDRMVDAMMSSRWQYEKVSSNPLGGRFFNQSALQPAPADAQQMRPDFKTWLIDMASKFPNQLSVEIPLQYANNTVTGSSACLKLDMVDGAPFRSNTPNILAKQKERQCRTAYQQTKSKFTRCENYRQGVTRAQAAYDKAQAAGCNTPSTETKAAGEAAGRCQINPNTDMAMLGQEMQRCLAQMCGSGPKTIGSVETYKACLQSAQGDLQAQVQAIMAGGGAASSGAAAPASNPSCRSAKEQLRQAELSLKGARCEDAQTLLPEPSCDFTSQIVQPDFWQVDGLRAENTRKCSSDKIFLRSNKYASVLLPGGAPYADTTLSMAMALEEPMMIPFDPPIQMQALYGTVKASTVLTITGLKDAAVDSGVMTFAARPGNMSYALP